MFRIVLLVAFFIASPICVAENLLQGVRNTSTVQINIANSNIVYGNKAALDSCNAYFSSSQTYQHVCRIGEVPPQVAIWLFLLAIIGFIVFLNRKKL